LQTFNNPRQYPSLPHSASVVQPPPLLLKSAAPPPSVQVLGQTHWPLVQTGSTPPHAQRRGSAGHVVLLLHEAIRSTRDSTPIHARMHSGYQKPTPRPTIAYG